MRKQTIKLAEAQVSELTSHQNNKECTKNELRRTQAILLADGGNTALIPSITGFTIKHGFMLRKKYLAHGIQALKDKKRKARSLLTKGQRAEIIKTITTRLPQEFGYSTDYWSPLLVGYLIKEQYGIQYKSRRPLYLLFEESKFTYHKPDTQYKARSQEKIDEWLETIGIEIKALAAEENVVILVEDEMMLTTQTTTQKLWLPQGVFPKIDISVKRELRCIYGFLHVKTGHQYAFKATGANSGETCRILNEIGKMNPNKKIVIVWDNASWHKSAAVKEFLGATKYKFHLINFPPYSPDLNPQENVWKIGRSQVTHNTFIENIDKATDKFVQFLNDHFFEYKFKPLVVS